MVKFQERLRKLRTEKKLTQKQLAETLDMSVFTVSLWERGERKPDSNSLELLSSFFGVSTSYLIGESYLRNPSDNPLDKATWEDDDDVLVEMAEEMTRLGSSSRIVLKELLDRLVLADQVTEQLRPEGLYQIRITKGESNC